MGDVGVWIKLFARRFFQVVERVINGCGEIGEVVTGVGEIRNFSRIGDFPQGELARGKGLVILGSDGTCSEVFGSRRTARTIAINAAESNTLFFIKILFLINEDAPLGALRAASDKLH